MPQPKLKSIFTLYPKRVAIVPFESIAGKDRTIFTFSDIDSGNSIVLNEASSLNDMISISESGMQFDLERSGEDIQVLDRFGLGSADEVQNAQDATITINVNGYGSDIQALLDGLNPKTEISNNTKFARDSRDDSVENIVGLDTEADFPFPSSENIQQGASDFTGTMIFEEGAGIAPNLSPPDNFTPATIKAKVVQGKIQKLEDIEILGGAGYTSSPDIDFTAVMKYIDSSGDEQTSGSFSFTGTITPPSTTSLGAHDLAAGSVRNDTVLKQKFSIIAEIETADEDAGSLFAMAPYTSIQSTTFSLALDGSKEDIALPFRGFKLLDPMAIKKLNNFAGSITSGSGMIYYWNSSPTST